MGKLFMELRKIITVIVYSVSAGIVLYALLYLMEVGHTFIWGH